MVAVIDQAALSVAVAAEKPAPRGYGRPVLQGVCIKGNRAAAADGYRLMVADLPKVDEQDQDAPAVLVDASSLTKAVTVVAGRARKGHTPTATVSEHVMGDEGRAAVLVSGETGASVPLPTIDGTFPAIDAIIPRSEHAKAVVAFNPILLADMLAAMGKAGCGVVRLEIISENQAMTVRGVLDDGRTITGVLMPMVIGKDQAALYTR